MTEFESLERNFYIEDAKAKTAQSLSWPLGVGWALLVYEKWDSPLLSIGVFIAIWFFMDFAYGRELNKAKLAIRAYHDAPKND